MCDIICDQTDLCSHFSASFRKKDPFESVKAVTKRHCFYYHFGKGLVEAVTDFGIDGDDEEGPFYSGLSCVLNVTQFAIYLKSPCSTSKDIEIILIITRVKRFFYLY